MALALKFPSFSCTVAREVEGWSAKSTEREQKKEEHFYQEELTD